MASWAHHAEQIALALAEAAKARDGGRQRRLVKSAWQHAQRCEELVSCQRERELTDRMWLILQEAGEAGIR